MNAPQVTWRHNPKKGECYKNAFQFVVDNRNWTLVHGICTCTNPLLRVDIGHAWAELRVDLTLPGGTIKWTWVADPTAMNIYPAEIYWHVGKVRHRRQYSFVQANELALHNEHYGPWDPVIMAVQHKPNKKRKNK